VIPWPALPPPPPVGGGEADAAVVVAIEDYAFLPDVPGARANGRAWAHWLRDTRGVPRVRTLTDAEATRETVAEAVAAARRQRGDDGLLWVVFIGHGAPGGQLLGADAQATAASLTHRRLRTDTLVDSATVAVLDACHADRAAPAGLQPAVPSWVDGAVALGPPPSRGAPAPRSVPSPAPPPAPATPPATVLLAAGPHQAAGPLPGAERPAFSYLVLGALRGWGDADSDGVITASEAVSYAEGVLFEQATDRLQTPRLRGSDRPLGRGHESAPRPALAAKTTASPPTPSPPPTPPARAASPTSRVERAATQPPAGVRPRSAGPGLFPRLRTTVRRLAPSARARARDRATEEPAAMSGGLLAAVFATALALVGLALQARRA